MKLYLVSRGSATRDTHKKAEQKLLVQHPRFVSVAAL